MTSSKWSSWLTRSKYTAVVSILKVDMGIILKRPIYGSLYYGSDYNTGPFMSFPHFGSSTLDQLPYTCLQKSGALIQTPSSRALIIRTPKKEPKFMEAAIYNIINCISRRLKQGLIKSTPSSLAIDPIRGPLQVGGRDSNYYWGLKNYQHHGLLFLL